MSFYTSLSGLRNAQTDLGVIAHNIANAETVGFKKSDTRFADLVAGGASSDPRMTRGIGAAVAAIAQDFGLGAIEQTGGATDLAIAGEGFFALRDAATGRLSFTRNGALSLGEDGHVHDGAGNRLQMFDAGSGGALTDARVAVINAAGAELAGIAIGKDGMLSATYADGTIATAGTIALATFTTPAGLRQIGGGKWEATGLSGVPQLRAPGEGRAGDLLAGALERSNVDLAEEMVGLIAAQRNFQANAKAIDAASQISQTIMNLRT
ncbi:flagellar hook basal-body protein [Erythrobacteraceae bacterium CFH 75059]|uniref:flagellar hook-basal body protein n=1 Tax=Qipengyuania thermophila TaxID=2509361 RepID=UPI00102260C0|nr:flagellar hook basal-body protein [Qipengyuania thermophila]TCD06290.1 flagellar hook basal-body protein [Erythrobacteraceae bacterium CFH 75059]